MSYAGVSWRTRWSLAVLGSFAMLSASAQQGTPGSLEDLWAIVRAQQAEINELKRQNADMQNRLAGETGSTVPVPVGKDVDDRDIEAMTEKDGSLEIYGFVQVDAIYDFDRVDPDWNDGTRPSKIPVEDPAVFGADGETILSVRQSRLGFRGTTPTSMGTLSTWLEWDLYAAGNDAGETELNLRHAWGELGAIGGGQTWSNFMDIDIFPNTIDYWGPPGMVFVRKPQVRYTGKLNEAGSLWAVALEDPGSDVDAGVFREVAPELADNVQTKNSLPDLTARYRGEYDWGHWQAAGIVRRLEFETVSDGAGGNPDNNPSGSEWGWGINLTSVANVIGNDNLKLGLVYGEGIASYFNDGGTATAPENNDVEPVESLGVTLFYDHYWNENWSTSVGWGMHEQDNTNQQTGDAFTKGQLAQINLLWSKEAFLTGFEAIWAERENNDGKDNSDFRLQYSLKYNFSHTR